MSEPHDPGEPPFRETGPRETGPREIGPRETGPREIAAGSAAAEERRQHALRLIEALLFAADRPLTLAELERHLPDTLVAGELVAELERHYRFRGINLVRVAGGFGFRTAPDLAAALAGGRAETKRLSRAQIETLAIVAYHQPVTRAEIEDIRGVAAGKGTLDLLVEAGWIAPKGRREGPGRPVTWVTTAAFLQHFALDSLGDLPNLQELKAVGLLEPAPALRLGETGAMAEGAAAPDDETPAS